MWTRITRGAFGVALAWGVAVQPTGATPLIGDETTIRLTLMQPVSTSFAGTVSINPSGDLVVPITGGSVSLPALGGRVEHLGSELSLTFFPDFPFPCGFCVFGPVTVTLRDLVFDLDLSLVIAQGTRSGDFVAADD